MNLAFDPVELAKVKKPFAKMRKLIPNDFPKQFVFKSYPDSRYRYVTNVTVDPQIKALYKLIMNAIKIDYMDVVLWLLQRYEVECFDCHRLCTMGVVNPYFERIKAVFPFGCFPDVFYHYHKKDPQMSYNYVYFWLFGCRDISEVETDPILNFVLTTKEVGDYAIEFIDRFPLNRLNSYKHWTYYRLQRRSRRPPKEQKKQKKPTFEVNGRRTVSRGCNMMLATRLANRMNNCYYEVKNNADHLCGYNFLQDVSLHAYTKKDMEFKTFEEHMAKISTERSPRPVWTRSNHKYLHKTFIKDVKMLLLLMRFPRGNFILRHKDVGEVIIRQLFKLHLDELETRNINVLRTFYELQTKIKGPLKKEFKEEIFEKSGILMDIEDKPALLHIVYAIHGVLPAKDQQHYRYILIKQLCRGKFYGVTVSVELSKALNMLFDFFNGRQDLTTDQILYIEMIHTIINEYCAMYETSLSKVIFKCIMVDDIFYHLNLDDHIKYQDILKICAPTVNPTGYNLAYYGYQPSNGGSFYSN